MRIIPSTILSVLCKKYFIFQDIEKYSVYTFTIERFVFHHPTLDTLVRHPTTYQNPFSYTGNSWDHFPGLLTSRYELVTWGDKSRKLIYAVAIIIEGTRI
ncbi:hypothetical protein NTE_02384 [Candidatus Nitrososphaera evergladensis SR1]|uniref:Uncharacterized protein n=1 Tax=Candidatus Nitrososphaera evergladensis SR1 TaxID=1459636 RepID=A0A075MS93_9ARCH|nr:hypothetical protein NTE_02384 [Candidatus Nitrososphaera evergladensis SR1]